MSENVIKSIAQHTCPGCGEEIFVEIQMIPSSVTSLFTEEDLATAKHDALARIETMTLDDDKRESVVKWINNPETIFSPSEVENIILSLLKSE